jgi:hypothetical protein
MKFGYLSILPAQFSTGQDSGGPRSDGRAALAKRLGFSEFYNDISNSIGIGRQSARRRSFLKATAEHSQRRAPRLASVGGVALEGHVQKSAPVLALAEEADTVYATSFEGYAPLSASWAEPDALSRHWSAHVMGCTHSARCARRSDWRVARTVYIDDDLARAEAMVKGPNSPCRAYYQARCPSADDATIDALIESCVLYGPQKHVMARLVELENALSGFGTLTLLDHDWADDARARRSIVLFAEGAVMARQFTDQRQLRKRGHA